MYQIQLSIKAGLSENFVREIEACRCSVTIKTIFALSAALDCDPRELVSSDEKKNERSNRRDIPQYILSSNLKRFRKILEISQRNLARKAKLTQKTIVSIEQCKQNVSLKTIFALASALDCDPCDLLKPIE